MKRFLQILVLLALGLPALAQNAFYTRLSSDADAAMDNQNYELAARYLEIAAFGLLDFPDQLAGVYVRSVVVFANLKNNEQLQVHLDKLRRLQPDGFKQPDQVSQETWDSFQVITGLKAKPMPPVPTREADLEKYVSTYPTSEAAWLALLKLRVDSSASKANATIADALKALPNSLAIQRQALIFDVVRNKGRNAKDLAESLLNQNPDDQIALETLGNLAILDKEFTKAKAYHDRVKNTFFDETADLLRKMDDGLSRAEASQKQREASHEAQKASEKSPKTVAAKEPDPKPKKVKSVAPSETKSKQVAQEAKAETAKPKSESQTKQANAAPIKAKPNRTEPAPAAKLDALAQAEKDALAKPKDIDAQFALVNAYLTDGKVRKASKVLEKLSASQTNHPSYIKTLAHYYYEDKSYSTAIRDLGKMANLDEESRYYLGMCYYKSGDLKSAKKNLAGLNTRNFPGLKEIQKAVGISTESESEPTPPQRGQQQEPKQTRQAEADPSKRSAPVADPLLNGSLEEQLPLFRRSIETGDWARVAEPLKKAARSNSSNPELAYLRARLYLHEGEHLKALESFNRLALSDVHKVDSLYYAGLAAKKSGDMDLAESLLRQSSNEGPEHREAINKLLSAATTGTITVNSKALSSLIKEYEEMTTKSEFPSVRLALLRLYAVTGNEKDFTRMRNDLNTRTLSPAQKGLLTAWTQWEQGKYKDALASLTGITGKESIFLRGYLYLTQGDKANSNVLFRSLSPIDFPEIASLLSL